MTPDQIATFVEERKWDYRGTPPAFCLDSEEKLDHAQCLVSRPLLSSISPSSGSSFRCRTASVLRCGPTVRQRFFFFVVRTREAHLGSFADLEKRQHYVADLKAGVIPGNSEGAPKPKAE